MTHDGEVLSVIAKAKSMHRSVIVNKTWFHAAFIPTMTSPDALSMRGFTHGWVTFCVGHMTLICLTSLEAELIPFPLMLNGLFI